MKHTYFSHYSRRLIHILFLAIISFSVSSCDSMLDLKPNDYLDDADLFTSVDRLERGVLGVYADWYPEYTIRIGSLMTDECRIGLQNSGVEALGQNIFRWTFTSSDDEILAPWENMYQVIGRVNSIMKGIDDVPVATEEEFQRLTSMKGELLAIRAYAHFELYRIYSYSGVYDAKALAVPYTTDVNINKQPSRSDAETFFEALWEDISEAEELNPKDADGRMGIAAIEALHARIALYTNKYSDAILYAGKVINKIPLASYSDFPLIWKDKSEAEIIFKLKRSNVSTIRPGDLFYNIGADRILFTPSLKLMESYDMDNDVRYESWFTTDESLIENGDLPDIIIKYEGEPTAQNRNDVKVFRVGEMYLIRAEAELKNGNINASGKDLNTLRSSRIKQYQTETFMNDENLLAAILDERFKELPYEGHRYFDLRRLHKSITRDTADVETDLRILSTESLHYNIPIPQSEVMANPNMRPNNKGW